MQLLTLPQATMFKVGLHGDGRRARDLLEESPEGDDDCEAVNILDNRIYLHFSRDTRWGYGSGHDVGSVGD